ncbi:MAG: hypothetical protein AMXMBFR16_12590 [Candidatus Uhrbacteria bacterium]|jgi:hypothetical protein|nr:MAG: hypothetical protein B6D36_15890 [Planctomycetes bacterium UTPLA1]
MRRLFGEVHAMRRLSWIAAAALFCVMVLARNAEAAPILLAKYNQAWPAGPSGAPPTDRVEFPLAHLRLGEVFPFTIGQDVSWFDGQPGSVVLNASNDSNFLAMAERLTDGLDEELFSMLFAGSSGVGSPQSESVQHGIAPDLIGNEIEYIRLNVNEISIVPFIHPQIGPRIQINASVSYEFWGTPVPEPTTLTLLFVAAILRRHRQRS